ncbi:Superoxide dismutase [Mycena indigotica]|uniref:Superoxide dismutase n=1 Tax=Mycena indigotica TaxID=2126181 RepID=A0A8H6VSV8_9AGAR|nr:Superoxide dismutase [Mycena indigotica]KAF7292757.1 Superoxide dismutase [Mycena indigotica]
MLSIARRSLRPSLARSLLAPALTSSLHTLPELPYAYNALEPYISEEIMTLHHKKHHQTYVTGLNAAEEAYSKLTGDSAAITKEKIGLQAALKFNGGGHINHSLFWKNLAPAGQDGGKISDGPLKAAIERDFGSVEEFKKTFNAKTAAIQGSGWGWLVWLQLRAEEARDRHDGKPGPPHKFHTPRSLALIFGSMLSISRQAHLTARTVLTNSPLKYKNVKPDYLNAIWNVINFKEAEKRLVEVTN